MDSLLLHSLKLTSAVVPLTAMMSQHSLRFFCIFRHIEIRVKSQIILI